MKIEEVRKVKNLMDETEINEYLSRGYHVIKIFSTKKITELGEEVQPMFILGLGKE